MLDQCVIMRFQDFALHVADEHMAFFGMTMVVCFAVLLILK